MSEDKGPHYLYRVVDKSSRFFAQVYSKRTGDSDVEYVRSDLVATAGVRRLCSQCNNELGFSEGDPCDRCTVE